MLGYHLFIAWKSIRRTPMHSLFMLAGFALGVAVATVFSAIRHTYTRDPIPQKSSVLYYVRLDSWDPREPRFLQMWVELPGAREVAAYKSFLDGYVMEQKKIGRFQRPLHNRVTPLLEYIRERGYPPPQATALAIAANLFLCACGLSLMGLLLSRFLSRAAEIGVRRALGARRWDIFLQHVIESEVVALAGGVLGLALAPIALRLVNAWYKTADSVSRDDLFRMDLTMVCFALAVSLGAGLLAGIYPAYRVCRVPPASHLKIQ